MSKLRDKTITGVFWSFLQRVGGKGISFLVLIVLARLLSKEAFGLVAMLEIFIEVSQTLVRGGFSQALIQKKEVDEEDYSSVFYINLCISLVLYLVLFFGAPYIAEFYHHQTILIPLIRVLSLTFIFNAFSYVQETRLKKKLHFKTLLLIHLPATLLSGIIAIIMAYRGYGVWSLVAQRVLMRLLYTLQLWIYAKWTPRRSFNGQKAKQLFSFGGNLMVVGILNTAFRNAYKVVIGKFFSTGTLGYYQNANSLSKTPISTISRAIMSVTFPVFSSIQDDTKRLKEGYKKTIQQILFVLCPILMLAVVLAEPLFNFVLTEKWLPAIPYFRILCIGFVFSPLNVYNINIINVKGRSDLFLKLDIVKKIVEAIGIVVAFVFFGIWTLVWFQSLYIIVKYLINSYYSGRFINYSLGHQIRDIYPIFIISFLVGGLVFSLNYWLMTGLAGSLRVLIGFVVGIGLYWFIVKLTNLAAYWDFVQIIRFGKAHLKKK